MELGLIGLGKMGGNMRQRLRAKGHTVVGYDRNAEISDSTSNQDMVSQLTQSPRVVWMMVPEAAVDSIVEELKGLLSPGDIVIDGGNSKWSNDQVHAATLAEAGIKFLDCGVSGGVWGLDLGYALMVGGEEADVATLQPIFDALKPESKYGFVHAGGHGAGHYSKMVHNGIEYAVMQAYAEGWELLEAAEEVVVDVPEIFKSWKEGTVIRSRRTLTSVPSRGTPMTPARADGRCSPQLTWPSRCRPSPRHCSPASCPARRTRRR